MVKRPLLGQSEGDLCQKGGPTLRISSTYRSGHGTDLDRQAAAARPMGERRDRNHEPDEALLPKPPAEAGPSKRVYLKQSDFDAHGLTQGVPGAEQCEKAYEHKVTQRHAVQEWKNSFEEQRRANNGWKRLNAAHGTRQASGPPNESSSSSPTDQQIP